MTDSLYYTLVDDDKRRTYCEQEMLKRLSNEGMIEPANFKLELDLLDSFLKFWIKDPFTYPLSQVPEIIQESVDNYIHGVQIWNEATFGKKTVSAKDIFPPEEYETYKHLLPKPPNNDDAGHSNDNLRVAILPY